MGRDWLRKLQLDWNRLLNIQAKQNDYRGEDLFSMLAGGKQFTTLDLSQAYQQVLLEESAKPYLTINTHRRLFQYNRMPFGVSSAPSIFQRIMDSLLQGLKHVIVYLDDILITSTTYEEHLKNLEEVLERLQNAGLQVKLKMSIPAAIRTILGVQDRSGRIAPD